MDMINDPHGAGHPRREVWVLLGEKCSCHDTGLQLRAQAKDQSQCARHRYHVESFWMGDTMPASPISRQCHHPHTVTTTCPSPYKCHMSHLPCGGFHFRHWFNFSDKVIKANLITMTHGLQCVLQTLILFTVLGEWAIITKAGTECF